MKTTDISNVLEEFVESNNRSLLIDGPWGCGKTYQIKEFINKQKNKRKCYYLSIFGTNSINELNNNLYATIHPNIVKAKRIASTALNICVNGIKNFPIPGAENISNIIDGLDFSLNNDNDSLNIPKAPIVIFDDLDRLGDNLKYPELLGYISSLFMKGVRFIGIISSNELEDNNESFEKFREKVFDAYHIINTTDEEIIKKILSETGIENLEIPISIVGNNIRRARKALVFYKKLLRHYQSINKNEEDIFAKFSKSDLLIGCILTVVICFEKEKFDTKNLNEFEGDAYQEVVNRYGKSFANTYFARRNIASKELFSIYEDLIDSLINAYLFLDYSIIDSILTANNQQILDKEYFLLSDNGKKEYEKAVKNLTSKEFTYKTELRKPLIVYFEVCNKITKLQLKNIAHSFQDDDSFSEFKSYCRLNDHKGNANRLFRNLDLLIQTKNDANKENIVKLFSSKEYENMTNFIYKIKRSEPNDSFNELLIKKKFFLPNLSNEITYEEWKYAHEIADYCVLQTLKKEFYDCLDKILEKNQKSNSLRQRINILKSKFDE